MVPAPALLAVGPPAGCSGPLEQLLDHSQSLPDRRLVFLGGYLAPGGDNETVVQMLRLAGGVPLSGAAEQLLIRRWRRASTPAEARSWLDHYGLSEDSFEWLLSLPPAPGPIPREWADRLSGTYAEGGPLAAVLLPEGQIWHSRSGRTAPAAAAALAGAVDDDLVDDLAEEA